MNANPIKRLICVSVSPRSRLMGCTSNVRMPRSRKFTMSAVAKIPTAYQAWRGLGHGCVAVDDAAGASATRLVSILVVTASLPGESGFEPDHHAPLPGDPICRLCVLSTLGAPPAALAV